jgi:hypothetical protein
MAANDISIADSNDRNMLDISGFDEFVPELIILLKMSKYYIFRNLIGYLNYLICVVFFD